MCYFEYNWKRSWDSLADIKHDVAAHGLVLEKTNSRTYQLLCPTALNPPTI